MKKKLALLLALILLVPVLSACHGRLESKEAESAGSTPIPEAFDDSKPIELVFWAKNDTNKVQTAVYTDAIAAFEKMYPNVKINLRLYPYRHLYDGPGRGAAAGRLDEGQPLRPGRERGPL